MCDRGKVLSQSKGFFLFFFVLFFFLLFEILWNRNWFAGHTRDIVDGSICSTEEILVLKPEFLIKRISTSFFETQTTE